jgi:hypothetical protein
MSQLTEKGINYDLGKRLFVESLLSFHPVQNNPLRQIGFRKD